MRYIRNPIAKFLFDGFGFGYIAKAPDGQLFRSFRPQIAITAMAHYMVADGQQGEGVLYRRRPWGTKAVAYVDVQFS